MASGASLLEDDFSALRKLRDDDASGALEEFFGDSEDPREWKRGGGSVKAVTVSDGRVTTLSLCECTEITALPAAIGELWNSRRILTALLRAGATLPRFCAVEPYQWFIGLDGGPPELRVALGGFDQFVGIPHALYVHAVAAAGGIEQYKRSRLNAIAATFIERLPVLPLEMVRRVVEFAFHVGDYCPGEYEIARKYRSGGWDERSYLRKLIKAANAEAVFSDD